MTTTSSSAKAFFLLGIVVKIDVVVDSVALPVRIEGEKVLQQNSVPKNPINDSHSLTQKSVASPHDVVIHWSLELFKCNVCCFPFGVDLLQAWRLEAVTYVYHQVCRSVRVQPTGFWRPLVR